MGKEWLEHQMTMEEKAFFVRDGYLLVPGVLGKMEVDHLSTAVDRVRNLIAGSHGVPLTDGFNLLDFMGLDEAFINLVDHPKTFPKLWAILGWNLCIYHSHLIVTPPLRDTKAVSRRHLVQRARPTATQSKEVKSVEDWWGWHRDSGQVNDDLGDGVPPRLSVKIAYYLSDALGDNDANMWVVPGSHVEGRMQPGFPGPKIVPPGSVPIRIAAGSAVFFDRRIVHSSSPNLGDHTRKVLFYGYGHRWIRPRDDMTVGDHLERSDSVRRQLLGGGTSAHGYSSPADEDVPLRGWMREHGLLSS